MRFLVFRHLYQMEREDLAVPEGQEAETGNDQKIESAAAQLQAAAAAAGSGLHEVAAVITRLLARRLARSLAVPVDDIDVSRPTHAFGVDSLVAVELRYWFLSEIRVELPVVQIMSNVTIAELGQVAAERCEYVREIPRSD